MESSDHNLGAANKAKLKIYGYTTGLLAILLVGSIIANVAVYSYIYQRVDQVSST